MASTQVEGDMRRSREKGFQIKKKKITMRPSSRGLMRNPSLNKKEKPSINDPLIDKQRLLELQMKKKRTMLRGKSNLDGQDLAPVAGRMASKRKSSQGGAKPRLKSISRTLKKN